jgi:hypothetical protein
MPKKLLLLGLAIVSSILLTGCTQSSIELYVFGPAKSCYQKNTLKDCTNYKAYDKLTLNANHAKQEVTFKLEAVGLDSSNVVFKTLPNCKIIDSRNFSCEGFSVSEGKAIENTFFKKRKVSNSGMLFSYSNFLTAEVSAKNIDFFNKNGQWIFFVLIAAVIIGLFWGAS